MIQIYSSTEKNLRKTNQDRLSCMRFALQNGEAVWSLAVADGMGGLADGEKYAELTLCAVQRCISETVFLTEQDPQNTSAAAFDCLFIQRLEQSANELLKCINAEVIDAADKLGMAEGGATVSVCVVVGDTLLCLNVGDSPIYLRRGGEFAELGVRDNAAEMMVRAGALTRDEKDSKEYEKNSSALLCFIGCRTEIQSHCSKQKLVSGDVVVLGTDGAFGFMNCSRWLDDVVSKTGASALCRKLVSTASRTTGDNQTVIVFEFSEAQKKRIWPFG